MASLEYVSVWDDISISECLWEFHWWGAVFSLCLRTSGGRVMAPSATRTTWKWNMSPHLWQWVFSLLNWFWSMLSLRQFEPCCQNPSIQFIKVFSLEFLCQDLTDKIMITNGYYWKMKMTLLLFTKVTNEVQRQFLFCERKNCFKFIFTWLGEIRNSSVAAYLN